MRLSAGSLVKAIALITSLSGLIGSIGIQAHAAQSTLSGEEIKRFVDGKRIYLQTPLGGEFPLFYKSNGKVDGSGDAIGLGRFVRPNDSGRWWVRDNRLCQEWERWYDGKRFCFTLKKVDGNTLIWNRDDGLSGRARIEK